MTEMCFTCHIFNDAIGKLLIRDACHRFAHFQKGILNHELVRLGKSKVINCKSLRDNK